MSEQVKPQRGRGKGPGIFERPKGSGIWWIRFRDGAGRDRRRRVGTKSQATNARIKLRGDVLSGRHVPGYREATVPTVAQAIDEYLMLSAHKRSARDDRLWGRLWKKELGSYRLDAVRPQQIEALRTRWAQQVTAATVNRRLAFLRHLYNVATRNGWQMANPVKAVGLLPENNARKRWLRAEE